MIKTGRELFAEDIIKQEKYGYSKGDLSKCIARQTLPNVYLDYYLLINHKGSDRYIAVVTRRNKLKGFGVLLLGYLLQLMPFYDEVRSDGRQLVLESYALNHKDIVMEKVQSVYGSDSGAIERRAKEFAKINKSELKIKWFEYEVTPKKKSL